MHISAVIKQKSYEKIEYILRRHPLTFVPTVIVHVILFVVPVIFYFVGQSLFPHIFENELMRVGGLLFSGAYMLCIIMFFFTSFTEFYLDVWIVTNDRVIDIEQVGLFSRTISEFDLFQIQDVTTDVHGMFATMVHYGDVTVKTASVTTDMVFKNIPRPDFIREEMLRLADIDRRYHSGITTAPGHPRHS